MNGLISTLVNEITQISGLAERNKSAGDIFFLCKTGAVEGSPLQILQGREEYTG